MFLKYLLSLAFHAAWMRAGKAGPIPRVPLPKGRGLPLPAIGPWQMLLVSWAARKLWQRYGDDVRTRIGKVDHPAAQKVHDWIPSTHPDPQAGRKTSNPPSTFVVPGISNPAPAGAAAASNSGAPSGQTQHLPNQNGSGPAGGSLLSRLRKGA